MATGVPIIVLLFVWAAPGSADSSAVVHMGGLLGMPLIGLVDVVMAKGTERGACAALKS